MQGDFCFKFGQGSSIDPIGIKIFKGSRMKFFFLLVEIWKLLLYKEKNNGEMVKHLNQITSDQMEM